MNMDIASGVIESRDTPLNGLLREVNRRCVWVVLAAFALAMSSVCSAGPAGPLTWTSTATVKASDAGWGRMTRLSNGDWLAVYTLFPSGQPTILEIARSTDNARTWSPVTTVAEAGRNVDNGFLFQLPNGTVLLTMRSIINAQSYRLTVHQSTNNGNNWSYLSLIDANENPGGLTNRGLWEPVFNLLPNGSLSVLYANEKYAGGSPVYAQVISQKISTNNGASWGAETWAVAEVGGGTARPGMPVMARMGDGRHVLVFEICGLGPDCEVSYQVSSNGTTWPSGLGTGIRYQRCGPYVLSTGDNRLVITSCQNEVSYSNDYAATWMKNDPPAWPIGFSYSWPAIYQTGSNELAVMNVTAGGAIQIKFGTLAAPTNNSSNFADNFDDGTDGGWARYGNNFSLASGRYLINNAPGSGNSSSKALAGDEARTSGTVEGDVYLSSAGNAGLMFRTTNAGFGPDEAFGYYVGLDSGGSVTLGRQADNWATLGSAAMTLNLNTWYHVKITFNGAAIAVYVGDMVTPRITATDSTFGRGQIGVRSHFANAQFDNVTFTRSVDVDDFQDGNDAGWSRYGGSVGFASGVYNLNNASGTGKSTWVTPASDLTVEADVRIASGAGDAGLVFRATSMGAGADAMNGYYAGINESADTLVLGRMNGAWTQLASVPLTVAANTWQRLKVVAVGSDIRVYVGDMSNPRIHVTDSTWASGAVGVRANFTNASFDLVTATK
jgi:hypothetical protein